MQMRMKGRKACIEVIEYGWEGPTRRDKGVRIPLGDLIQIMYAYSFKKGENRVDSNLSVYWLLTHDFVSSNIDACTSLGNFWSILSN